MNRRLCAIFLMKKTVGKNCVEMINEGNESQIMRNCFDEEDRWKEDCVEMINEGNESQVMRVQRRGGCPGNLNTTLYVFQQGRVYIIICVYCERSDMRILLYLGTIGLLLGEVKLKRNNLKLSFTCIEETFLIFKKMRNQKKNRKRLSTHRRRY